MVAKRGLIIIILLITVVLSMIYVRASLNAGLITNSAIESELFVVRDLAIVQTSYPYNVEYAHEYLNMMNNFTLTDFKGEADYSLLSVGNKNENIYGVIIDGQKFAVHLLGCDLSNLACMFRINGVPIGRLHEPGLFKKSSFDINENYTLQINSIVFDYCGGARFCDLEKEAYHAVNISVMRK